MVPPTATTGTLELKSEPPGATVFLDGRLLGITPVKADVAAGAYQVTLRKEGFADQSFPVRVAVGRPTSELRPLVAVGAPPTVTPPPSTTPAEVAVLIVLSDPPGAAVYLDDEPLGATDPGSGRLVKTGVKAGSHTVRVSLAGRLDASQSLDVAPSGATSVRLTLAPVPQAGLPPAALAAIAVGALVLLAAVAFVLKRRRAADEAPGTVALPRTPPPRRGPPATVAPATPRRTAIGAPTVGSGAPETRAIRPQSGASAVGKRFGEYMLVEQLGKGGMAHVFLAERGGELYALKRPLPAFLEEAEFLERFLREAEIGRTLHHPNIIRIFERGDVHGVPYFTMELVKGQTLQAHVRANGALEPREAARIVSQVAEALDYAHLKGIIHRDLKPSNIMVLDDGDVKVMDYGIARARRFDGLTVTGAFLGTPDYVAPETAEGKGTDARSDLYSLGIVFYEILTGRKPFVGDTPFATLRKHCTEPPTPPSLVIAGVPAEIEAIILKLLAKNPDERYPGAEELLIALRDYLNRAA